MKTIICFLLFLLAVSINAQTRYVTVSGSSANDGLTENTAWSLSHAISSATGGMIINVKSGLYSGSYTQLNDGSISNPIKFVGYVNTPGDIVSNNASTFQRTKMYNELPSAFIMPLIRGIDENSGTGLKVDGDFVFFENIQVERFALSIIWNGDNGGCKNCVTNQNGEQDNNNLQNGRGFHLYGNSNLIEDCFFLNANAEMFNIKGGSNNVVKNSVAWSDNVLNPGGYYFAITGLDGSNPIKYGESNVFENCTVFRRPEADLHRGHGFVLKDAARNNIVRDSETFNTGIEVNFSGVFDNIFENINVYGHFSEDSSEFSSNIRVLNGAHNNIFRNIYIEDSRYPFNFHDFDDGYANSNGDRDEAQGGNNNSFVNIIGNRFDSVISFSSEVDGNSLYSWDNTFYNCTFYNHTGGGGYINSDQITSGTKFINCAFDTFSVGYPSDYVTNGTAPVVYENCNFSNCSYVPSGGSITTYSSDFIGTTSAEDFALSSSSQLINKGITTLFNTDFNDKVRFNFDIGAFEFGGTFPTNSNTKNKKNEIVNFLTN